MKTILFVFGTRPEAIKLCPLILELRERREARAVVCVTGQHRGLLDQALDAFGVVPDFDLDLMRGEQSLTEITVGVLEGLPPVLDAVRPDAVLVQGDTTTAFAAALACFYRRIPVGHVEAGLRTYDMAAPFPEELNRLAADGMARWMFAPTERARQNLLREGRRPEWIFVTGNTIVDALKTTVREAYSHPALDWARGSRLVFITAHRRESWGPPLRRALRAIRRVMEEHPDVKAVYPVHPNPAVRGAAEAELGGLDRVRLVEPLGVADCHNLMARSYLILTDSGGIQEEAPYLGKPVLVLRDATERPEGVEAGVLRPVGTDEAVIYDSFTELLDSPAAYGAMARPAAPYGDGAASRRIADILLEA